MQSKATELYRSSALILCILLFGITQVWAQSGKISGQVTDARTGQPLVGANVYVLGTQLGSATDVDGLYIINVPAGTYDVRTDYVSYKTSTASVDVVAGETAQQNFALSTDFVGTDEVVVVGSRFSGRTVIESPVPIDVITEAEIKQSGFSETTQVLQLLIPSYNAPQPSITDGSDHMRPATLRGLGPDQVLILINGKRRHTSALVHVNGSIGRGSTGVDMNSIPASSIERIEVLRDGASAQYGSDAISGVINVVLKDQVGFDASVTYSQYMSTTTRGFAENEGNRPTDDASTFSWDGDGAVGSPEDVDYDDGQTTNLHLGYGSKIMGDGHLYVSTQLRARDFANRAGLDPRTQYIDDGTNAANEESFNRLNHRFGNGEFSDVSIFFNGYVPLNDEGTQLYGFGGFNKRHGESGCFYRRSLDNRTVRAIHPDGFLPIMNNDLEDLSVAAGIKGAYGNWAYDASTVFGKNSFNFGVENTNNASLGLNSATEFDAGTLKFQQATSNLDILGTADIGTAKALNIAFGAEVRWENYKIDPGEETSFLNGGETVLDGPNAGAAAPVGASCFPGFSGRNVRDASRMVLGGYIDLENNLTDNFLLSVAGRVENYTDFGTQSTAKVAGRFELVDGIAVRGAVSTGYRAPSLAQSNYSAIATNFIDGVPFEVGTFPVDDPVARALGATDLEAETSINLSAGVTMSFGNFSLTADGYQITIDDRIVFTENFTGSAIASFLGGLGIDANGGRYFTNAVNTETRGLDLVGRYGTQLGSGTLRLTAAVAFNETEITNKDEINTPDVLAAITDVPLFGRVEQGRFEVGQPQDKINLSANYSVSALSFTGRVQRYGEVTNINSAAPVNGVNPRDQVFASKWITDVELGYDIAKGYKVAVGANNLLDVYPDKQLKANTFNGIFPYSGLSPFGFFGRSVYARLDLSL